MRKMLISLLCSVLLAACHPANPMEQLEAAVDGMRVQQRLADNRAFYDCYVRARRLISLIEEEEPELTKDEQLQFQREKDEFYLISVTYQHTMGHHEQARADMDSIREEGLAGRDTVQWLHYRFLRSLSARVDDEELARQAWVLASYGDSAYWSTEARIHRAAAMNREGHYLAALDTLQLAYDCIADDNVPECLCRISEQVSVAYAGLNKKDSSDIYRNIYLDMLEVIRENKELEYRSQVLERRTTQLRGLTCGFVAFLVLFAIAFAALAVHARLRHLRFTKEMTSEYDERISRFRDELAMHRHRLGEYKRSGVRRRASLSIVTGIIPLIDRARHAIKRLRANPTADDSAQLAFISELTTQIEQQNEVLTQWIQTRQGMVSLHVESFAVQELFDIVARRRRAFAEQGLELNAEPTEAWVKADRALTLFMLNTLTDNARKFTPEGGSVRLSAEEHDDYVELSVADTGIGLTADEVGQLLARGPAEHKGSGGFGLMNCKGIIEKYRKTDTFFSVCRLGVDSTPGKGSRFWFRLPRVARRALLVLVMLMAGLPSGAATNTSSEGNAYDPLLTAAAAYADSVYYANVDGDYDDALCYGDSAIAYLNAYLRRHSDGGLDTLSLTGERGGIVETAWWMSDFETDYYTILDIRNELAIAFLALHQWDDYRFNNRAYTELYKLTSEDNTLEAYLGQMQKSSRDMVTMLVLSLLLLLTFIVLWIVLIVRPRREHRRQLEQRNRELDALMSEDSEMRRVRYEENRLHVQNLVLDNCLSAIKHETAYYPGRIRQIADHLCAATPGTDTEKQINDMDELVDFYRDIFGTLAACASHQLEEVTFNRSAVPCETLLATAVDYLQRKTAATGDTEMQLTVTHDGSTADGDVVLLDYLMECLIDEALTDSRPRSLALAAAKEGDFICFRFTDPARTLTAEERHDLFYPTVEGTTFIICRQIVREHDEFFGHIGCRIKAEQASPDGGITILFTIPAESRQISKQNDKKQIT